MANILTVKNAGIKHWDDPTAWVGGVVPGKTDRAYIESDFTRINFGNGYLPWEGTKSEIRVDTTSGFPATSGSFYTYTYLSQNIIKVDYDTINGDDYFNSCSIDHSFREWSTSQSGSVDDDKAYGYLKNDAPVFRMDHTHIYVSGSSTWHVGRVYVRDHAKFTVKDTATLALDSDPEDAFVGIADACFEMFDQSNAILTGSTERNSSLIHLEDDVYCSVNISGSSDLRTRTTVSTSVNTGSGIIPVANGSNFEPGDYISIYGKHDVEVQGTHGINTNSDYEPYYYTTTGSIYPYFHNNVVKDEDETFEVCAVNGNNLIVKKKFTPVGTVTHTQGAITRRVYQKDHGRSKSRFTGNKTSISVRSENNQYKAGDRLAIGNNVYTVLEVADKLIPFKTVDFVNGDNLDDFWVDEFIGSGSTNEIKCNSGFITGSTGLQMSGSLVGTSNYYKSLFMKDMKLRDLKVTLTCSQVDDSGNWNGDRMAGVSICEEPYNRDRVLSFYNRYTYAKASYIGIYSDDVYYGSRVDHWSRLDGDDLINTPNISSGMREGEVTVEINALRENVDFTYQGQYLNSSVINRKAGSVAIHLRREGSSIKKLIVEEYVQELVLDTTDSISVGSKVHLTGTEVLHPSGQEVVKIASTITDMRGYENIPSKFAKGKDLTDCVVPVLWSNNGNQNRYRTSSTSSDRARIDSLFLDLNHYDYYLRLDSSNQSFIDLNLGKEVDIDAVGLAHFYNLPSHYPATYPKGVGIEYSTDGHTWSVARAQADDTRLSNQGADYRIYQFSEITARFLRIRLNGASNTSNNRIVAMGFYKFDGRGSSIELNNTSDLAVGDTITFMNPQGIRAGGYINSHHRNNYRSAVLAGTKTASDYPGGITLHYTITAKTGNVITLDRLIEGYEIHPDTLVVKLDRGITVKSQAGISNCIPFGGFYSDSSSNPCYINIENASFLSLGSNSRERMYFYRHPYVGKYNVSNNAFHYIEPGSPYFNNSGMVRKNNAWINASSFSNRGSRMHSDHKTHGEISTSYNYQFKNVHATSDYYSGNIIDAGRYMYINSHSTPYEGGSNRLTIRNNYFTFQDYVNFQLGADHGRETAPKNNTNIYDNVERQGSGYRRTYNDHYGVHSNPNNRIESTKYYPFTYPNGFRWYSEANILDYQAMGTDYHEMSPIIGKDYVSNRNLLVDNGRRLIIQNKDKKNQYDMVNISLNRAAPLLMSANFSVYEEQEIRVQQKMTYKTPFGQYYDNYLGSTTSTNKDIKGVLLYQDRTVTIQAAPISLTFTDFTFDYSFTAKPGNYLYMLLNRNRAYCQTLFTFKDMSFNVTGTIPNKVFISQNLFKEHKVLRRPDKIALADYSGKQKVPKKLGSRTTVKLRKFKF